MPHTDFDIARLAAYLHLTPKQVTRLAEREKIPGRKVGGQWRFSRAEIHHWVEERIGLVEEEEFEHVETVVRRATPGGEFADEATIAELLEIDAIAVPLVARTRLSVIEGMVDLAAKTGLLWEPRKMSEAVQTREQLHSTALDVGVALLHPRRPMANILEGPLLAFGRTSTSIPFGGKFMTDIFFLICSTSDRGHLQILARLTRLLAHPGVLTGLREAPDAATIRDILCQAEAELY